MSPLANCLHCSCHRSSRCRIARTAYCSGCGKYSCVQGKAVVREISRKIIGRMGVAAGEDESSILLPAAEGEMDIQRVRLRPEEPGIPVGVFRRVEELEICPADDGAGSEYDIIVGRGFLAHGQVLLRIEELWPDGTQRDARISRDIEGRLTRLALLGRNEDNAVDTLAPIYGGGVRIPEDADAFDIGGIDAAKRADAITGHPADGTGGDGVGI